MNILDNLKILQKIKTLEELKNEYDFNKLNSLRTVIINLLKECDIEFKKELVSHSYSQDKLLKIWNSKTNLEKLHELVFKALSAFEREELIEKTTLLTNKLSNIVQHIEKEDNVKN